MVVMLLRAASSPAADAQVPIGRLPHTTVPTAYRLDLTIVPERERFSGHVEIDIRLNEPAGFVFLHGRDLSVSSVVVLSGGKSLPATYRQLDERGTSRVDFPQPLPAGDATLVFDYDARFGDSTAGLYRLKVGDDWYAWTQFESIDARAAFPSFDDPSFKTPFSVTLTTRPEHLALSNMPETGAAVPAGDLVRHRFLPSPPLPTYLVAFVAGPFISVSGMAPATKLRNSSLPLRIVATRTQAGRLDYALRETPRIVELLEEYFGQPFPYPKLDQIGSPILPGAMENAGADIYRDSILLLAPDASTARKQTFGMVVSHELAHQWFGDYVTPVWWDDIWLNESFANWMGYRIGNEWRPELNIGVNAIDEALDAMASDSLGAGRPMRQAITDSGEVNATFDSITYGKGGQIIAMIAAYLGDDRFREGVRLHLRRRPYGNATSDDFFAALADAAGDARVLSAMQGFVNQQGVPVIDLVREGAGYRISQSRYLALGSKAPQQQWIIPFCVRRGATRTCTLLDSPSAQIMPAGSGALVPNAGGTGYYRYSLSEADWNALLAEAASMPAGEELAAIDSLWAQAATGKLHIDLLLRAASAFAANPDSNVALYSGFKLARWAHTGLIDSPADYRRVMHNLFAAKLAAMGTSARAKAYAGDEPDRQKLREDLMDMVATEARDPVLRRELASAARSYLAGDAQALDESLLALALTMYLQEGTFANTQALQARMLKTTDERFRGAALAALASTERLQDAKWLLEQLGKRTFRATEGTTLLAIMMRSPVTRDVAFDWLVSHYGDFVKRGGIFAALSVPRMPQGYCSAKRANEVEAALLPKVREANRGELPFQRTLETIRNCAALDSARGAEIAAAMKQAAAL